MTKTNYDLLVDEMDTIARKVALFPKELQTSVYKNMVATLLGEPNGQIESDGSNLDKVNESARSNLPDSEGHVRNYASEIEKYYSDYNLADFNDMEVATFTAYYFAFLAPPDLKTEVIDSNHYEELCTITGRKFPKNARKTLNNAKHVRRYLDTSGSGTYTLTKFGEHYVKNKMLNNNQ